MSINKICQFLVAAILLCGTGVIISCSSDDSDSDGGSIAKPAVLKQGIWTEYDTVLVASGKQASTPWSSWPRCPPSACGLKATRATSSPIRVRKPASP